MYDGYSFIHHRHDPDAPNSVANDDVLSLLVDSAGRNWVGTENGLDRFDRRTSRFRHYRLGRVPGQTEPIVALHEDRQGVIWTGTNGRLYRHDAAADHFREFEPFTGMPDALGEPYVSGIQEDDQGTLWVLSKNLWQNRASLYRVDVPAEKVRRYPMVPEWGQLGPFRIDSRGDFWFKAPAPADFSPDREDRVRPSQPPVEQIHWGIFEDSQGVVWPTTDSGFYRKEPAEPEATFHRIVPTAADTAPWNWTLCFYEDPAGNLLVGTRGGIYRRIGTSAAAGTYAPRISLARIQVSGMDGSRDVSTDSTNSLELDHRDYGLSFEFTAADYIDPLGIRYRYQLEPFDRGWVGADERRLAIYTNIPPGEYTFHVQGLRVGDGPSPASLAFPVTIRPPYWQTWWFRLLVGVTIGAAIAGMLVYRAGRRRDLERLRLRIAGDLRSSHAMLEDLRDLVWMIDPGHDRIEDLVAKMSAVAETLLPENTSFEGGKISGANRIDMITRREILRLYKELLHNVVRHAQATEVKIRVGETNGALVLRVQDNGVGFSAEAPATGFGLKSLQARARRLGGELQIDSQPGGGTTATFALPLG